MEFKRFNDMIVVRIDRGEEVVSKVMELAKKENIQLGVISALGAAGKATVGLFNTETKQYQKTELNGEYEITNLTGNISTMNDETYLHLHVTLSDEEYRAYGGHLNELVISGTCEMFIQVIDGQLDRRFDEEVGLNVFKF
ncbi:PPC domain-containing DNA-binding protein [Vallitalea okinawensis]|uniref:PPC domain-containing DNA-binding protein n=1 Tax=Vallitalea okinawensis TaxID=2078660 RepID=UPI000CFCCFA1|nr:PPC domain-containing DNA-binding protein [Vallitalea okinawensis]